MACNASGSCFSRVGKEFFDRSYLYLMNAFATLFRCDYSRLYQGPKQHNTLGLFWNMLQIAKHFPGVSSWSLEFFTTNGVLLIAPPTKADASIVTAMGKGLESATVWAVSVGDLKSFSFHLGRFHGHIAMTRESRDRYVRAMEPYLAKA